MDQILANVYIYTYTTIQLFVVSKFFIFVFSKDALNCSKGTFINTKDSYLNKCCSFDLYYYDFNINNNSAVITGKKYMFNTLK